MGFIRDQRPLDPRKAPPLACTVFLLLLLLWPFESPAAGPDETRLEFGHAVALGDARMARFAVLWDWGGPLASAGGGWQLRGSWEASLGAWSCSGDRTITEAGLTPVFRFEREARGPLSYRPFFEAAVGAHLISDVELCGRRFSTAYQFGDHVGFGAKLGKEGRLSLLYKFQHLSNAGIRNPNSGINFSIVHLRFEF